MQMFARRFAYPIYASLLSMALVGACAGEVGRANLGTGGSSAGNAGAGGSAAGNAGAGGSTGGTTGGSAGGTTGASGSGFSDNPYIPARIRRLTNAEYDASVQALLGTTMAPSTKF